MPVRCTTPSGVCRRWPYCEPDEYTNCLACEPEIREPCDAGVPDVPADAGIDAADADGRAEDGRTEDGRAEDGRSDEWPDGGPVSAEGGGCACGIGGMSSFHLALLILWISLGLLALRCDHRQDG